MILETIYVIMVAVTKYHNVLSSYSKFFLIVIEKEKFQEAIKLKNGITASSKESVAAIMCRLKVRFCLNFPTYECGQ
jgi:hypothetical protein